MSAIMGILRRGNALKLRGLARVGLCAALLAAVGVGVRAITTDLGLVGELHEGAFEEHVDQEELLELVEGGEAEEAFEEAFEAGNEFFETRFNALDGVGANVGKGQRFTRVPRSDLNGNGEWADHRPRRATGPNAESCTGCHIDPAEDGSGGAVGNVHRDPQHRGILARFIQRNTPHLFGSGGVQRLAEEMTATLQSLVEDAKTTLCETGGSATVALEAKGVQFGSVRITRLRRNPCNFRVDTSNLHGVDGDLVVRPFQWKGSVAFLRDFNRGASHNELGMQAVEIVGEGADGDFDGVADEMTIGDQTALAVYVAAQPRPTTKLELNGLGLLVPALTQDEIDAIGRGSSVFEALGCATCHIPSLTVDDPVFSEPSQSADYRDAVFPAGQDPVELGVDPENPVTFDITEDQPDNQLTLPDNSIAHIGPFETDMDGKAIIRLFGDLKRHNMGVGLAEPIDEVGTGRATFLTENLWGCGSTAPFLHDGRATTLTEAILEHGGEALAARTAFEALPLTDQADLIAFLNNLILFKVEAEEE